MQTKHAYYSPEPWPFFFHMGLVRTVSMRVWNIISLLCVVILCLGTNPLSESLRNPIDQHAP